MEGEEALHRLGLLAFLLMKGTPLGDYLTRLSAEPNRKRIKADPELGPRAVLLKMQHTGAEHNGIPPQTLRIYPLINPNKIEITSDDPAPSDHEEHPFIEFGITLLPKAYATHIINARLQTWYLECFFRQGDDPLVAPAQLARTLRSFDTGARINSVQMDTKRWIALSKRVGVLFPHHKEFPGPTKALFKKVIYLRRSRATRIFIALRIKQEEEPLQADQAQAIKDLCDKRFFVIHLGDQVRFADIGHGYALVYKKDYAKPIAEIRNYIKEHVGDTFNSAKLYWG